MKWLIDLAGPVLAKRLVIVAISAAVGALAAAGLMEADLAQALRDVLSGW